MVDYDSIGSWDGLSPDVRDAHAVRMAHTKLKECSYWRRRTALYELTEKPTHEQLVELFTQDLTDVPCGGTFYEEDGGFGTAVDCDACQDNFLDEDGCLNRPLRLGDKALIWINCYEVTRHYGGHEEGGWWYNAGEPLASMPVLATVVLAEGDRELSVVPTSEPMAKTFEEHLERIFGELRRGNIYSVLGGEDIQICRESHQAEHWPARRPRYE